MASNKLSTHNNKTVKTTLTHKIKQKKKKKNEKNRRQKRKPKQTNVTRQKILHETRNKKMEEICRPLNVLKGNRQFFTAQFVHRKEGDTHTLAH